MNNAIVYGDKNISFCYSPWKDHVYSYYKKTNVLILNYKKLMLDPFAECERIIKHLNIYRDADHIKAAINIQSFQNRKKAAIEQKDFANAHFLRSGKINQWESKLTLKEKIFFQNKLGTVFKELGYDL